MSWRVAASMAARTSICCSMVDMLASLSSAPRRTFAWGDDIIRVTHTGARGEGHEPPGARLARTGFGPRRGLLDLCARHRRRDGSGRRPALNRGGHGQSPSCVSFFLSSFVSYLSFFLSSFVSYVSFFLSSFVSSRGVCPPGALCGAGHPPLPRGHTPLSRPSFP